MTDDAHGALESVAATATDKPRWRERQVTALAELALRGLQDIATDTVLEYAAEQLREALGCEFSKILDGRAGAFGLLVRAGSGWPEGVVGEREVPEGLESQAGYTLQQGQPVIVDDTLDESRFTPAPLLLEHGIRSGLSVVIAGAPEPFGVLQVDSRTPSRFSPADIPIVQAYANVLSIIVEQREREQLAAGFASIAAHELRTPLTSLIGYSSRLHKRLRQHGTIGPEQQEEVEALYEESVRMRRAVDIYLALGEIERRSVLPDVGEFDLMEAARSAVLEVTQRFPSAVIALEATGTLTPWISDEVSVQRILSNLVENGIKYSPTGSTISVEIGVTPGAEDDSSVSIRVLDRCGGLPDEVLRRLFDRSYRGPDVGSRSGLGLGLYVSWRLAERIGARLTAANEGEGCVFTLRLPAVPFPTRR